MSMGEGKKAAPQVRCGQGLSLRWPQAVLARTYKAFGSLRALNLHGQKALGGVKPVPSLLVIRWLEFLSPTPYLAPCPLLQIRPHHVAVGALQAHEQSVVGFGTAVAGFQVMLHLRQQMRGHLGIGQGPVGTA